MVKQLLGEQFDEHENATLGISIRVWKTEAAGRNIQVNLWDFGGHDTMHASHQFFLSKRSLYILVLDRGCDERTEYWLQHIKTFGGNSPVLVVLNKQDAHADFNVNHAFLREHHHNIREFFHTSCKTGIGVATFKEALLAELAKVEMIAIRWTEPWFAVKLRIEEMRRPCIGYKKYLSVCGEERINNEKTCKMLVEFLHDLGAVVHFKDFILDDMHVLDTAWATNAVYMIITAPELAASRGVLHAASFFKILWQNDVGKCSCPQETHPYIMSLMQKLELCYELDKESVLVPQLLPVSEPQFAFEQRGTLRFILHYPDFLPPSVFPRFMVKVHKDIEGDLRWRTGLVLEDKQNGIRALIKADAEARRINIWVQGERRREYLHYLRYSLAAINTSFENLKVVELVPIPDARDIIADYETLLKCVAHEIDRYVPDGSDKVYSIRELLVLVQPKDKEELVRLVEKIGLKSDGKAAWLEMISSLADVKTGLLGIAFNLDGFFKEFLLLEKEKRHTSRR